MQSIQMTGTTGPDGVLHLSVPLETPNQEYTVLVYVHPRVTEWPPGYFEETFGSITDETFERPPQCPHEKPAGS
jgi:hypothetical protein